MYQEIGNLTWISRGLVFGWSQFEGMNKPSKNIVTQVKVVKNDTQNHLATYSKVYSRSHIHLIILNSILFRNNKSERIFPA